MIILCVFEPFRETILQKDRNGPVTATLRELLANPPLLRNTQPNTVDTNKALRNLRIAVSEHLDQFPNSQHAAILQQLLNSKGHQDPGELWEPLYGVTREELKITEENSPIGIQASRTITCTRCGNCRMSNSDKDQYIFQAVALGDLAEAPRPSVQKAIQVILSPELISARCCDGRNDLEHTDFLECHKGSSGIVFYGPFHDYDSGDLSRYKRTTFQIEQEIRIPFQGPSSGYQSVYELTGFTARPLHRRHHVAVIYDTKGQPWTYDDAVIKKGLPEGKWVPGLIFYHLWQEQVQASDVEFPGPANIGAQPLHSEESDASDLSNPPSPQGCTTKSGRNSQQTNFYRPPQTKNKTRTNTTKKAANCLASTASSGPGDACSQPSEPLQSQQGAPKTPTHLQPVTPSQQSRARSGKEWTNERAASLPKNSLAWVRYDDTDHQRISQGSYIVARILGPASPSYMNVSWEIDNIEQKRARVHNKRVL